MMFSKSLGPKTKFSGVTVGGSGGEQPLSLVILTVVVFAMAMITVFDSVLGDSGGVDYSKEIPFKCTDEDCGEVVYYTLGKLKEMQKPGSMGPMMGPLVLDCPACGEHTLTQAVKCPKCGEVFIMKMDPSAGLFDDKCPNCDVSYSKAWQEEYKKKHGK